MRLYAIIYPVANVGWVKLLLSSNKIARSDWIRRTRFNVNVCVSDFPPGVCPSAPGDISLDRLMHYQTNRQTFKNNACATLFRIESVKIRADQNGRWTNNDDETFDGRSKRKAYGATEIFHSRMGGICPHEGFIHSCAHGDKAPREYRRLISWTSIICSWVWYRLEKLHQLSNPSENTVWNFTRTILSKVFQEILLKIMRKLYRIFTEISQNLYRNSCD